MNLLKKIPITYVGELHQVQLINFSVDKREVESYIPWKITVREFEGRAMISIVNVQLRHMHPTFVHESLHVNYRHIGFRLLVEDRKWNHGINKGVYFIQSFTDNALIAQGGQLFTDYKLEKADIICTDQLLALKKGEKYLTYALDDHIPTLLNKNLQQTIGTLDRAYSELDGQIRMTKIMREKWPLEPVNCFHFKTNFFETARLEGAFKINEPIHYQWNPPQNIR
jgi:hypothetical protein